MDLICQKESISELYRFAESDKHSVLIEGTPGSGKTYLAKLYSKILDIPDFQIVSPNVSELRSTVETCMMLNNKIVIGIENLDLGVAAASYAILKFLEEPTSNVYIVVTCRNIKKIPETIISRSACISTCPPIDKDIDLYCKTKYPKVYDEVHHRLSLYKCLRTFVDIDTICSLSEDKLDYILTLKDLNFDNDPVSNLVWSLGHFPDNSECPLEIVIKYIIDNSTSTTVKQSGIECIRSISQGRIAKHTALTKFVFDVKYIE